MTKNRVFILALAAICFTLTCAFLFIDRAHASPAAPVVVTLTQPDGSTFTARAWGDEWNNGVETLDGYSILRTPAGWWAYASLQADGSLGPAYSGSQLLLVGMPLPADLTPHLRSTASRENPRTPSRTEPAESGLESPGAPAANAIKTLGLQAKFSDRSVTYSTTIFQALVVSTTPSATWNNYREGSCNNLDIIPTVENCSRTNAGRTLVALVQGYDANHLYYGDNNGENYGPYPGDVYHHNHTLPDGSTPNSNPYCGDTSFANLRAIESPSASMEACYLSYAPNAPLPFVKLSPANLSVGLSTRLTLDWADASEATSYAYCYDDDPNGTCTGSWTSTEDFSQATLTGLETDTTYEWQASASNTGGTTYANTATTWTFTTGSIAYSFNSFLPQVYRPIPPPSTFTKIHPSQNATGISTSPILDWADAGGVLTYDFCYDLTVNGVCTGGWTSTGTTSQVRLFGLPYNTTYEWQVRAINSGGTTYANSNMTWHFTTIPATGSWTFITSENFETAIPKTGWSRHDFSNTDNGEYFIGQRNAPCPVYAGSYSGWLIGAGAQGSALGCGAAYVPHQNSWFIYGPFNTLNATAGQVNFNFHVNSEQDRDFFTVWATDDYTGTWTGLAWSGTYSPAWQSGTLNLGEKFCGGNSINCLGLDEVYIAFSFDSDESVNTYAHGAIIDNIILRICNAGSCTTGSPIFNEAAPFPSDAIQDFLQPFLQQFGKIRIGRLPPGAFE